MSHRGYLGKMSRQHAWSPIFCFPTTTTSTRVPSLCVSLEKNTPRQGE